MLFLIATVVFALSEMLNVSSGSVIDGQRQEDSTAAFFLAESGLDKGRAALMSAQLLTDSVCTGMGPPYALGRGNVVLSGAPDSTPCGGSGQPACNSCTLTATGTVGFASRTITQSINLNVVDGVGCTEAISPGCTNNPTPTWWLDLKNPYAIDAIGLFSLAANKQGAQTGATCINAPCQLAWDSGKMTGQHAVESMGNIVTIPATKSYQIYQTGTTDDLAEVGMLFRGLTTAPTLTGRHSSGAATVPGAAYWGSSLKQKYPAALIGQTNDGTATNSANEVCNDPASSSNQTCTSWCYGGDTLVFGFAAEAASIADDISSVTFNTQGATAQNILLTPFIIEHKYPTAGAANNPPTDIYSSIWYKRNPAFLSASDVRSGALLTGYAGTSFTGSTSKNNATLTVTNLTGPPLQAGSIIGGNIDANTQICPFGTGGTNGTGGNGTYTVFATGSCASPANQSANRNNASMGVSSTVLTITSATIANLAVGDKIFVSGAPGATIVGLVTGSGGVGTYNLSAPQQFGSTTITSDGQTVTSATGTSVPAVGTIVSKTSGNGTLKGGTTTTVAQTPPPTATTFNLSQRPDLPLSGATICGGTCAFFVHGGNTQFTLTKTPTDLSWAAGFVCLKGVDIEPQKVTSSRITPNLWKEAVQ
jgi:hypothetical protein